MSGLKLVFAGTPDFAAVVLERLLESSHEVSAVFAQPPRAAGRGRRARDGAVAALARRRGLVLRQPDTPGADDAAILAAADVMAVVAYGRILAAEMLPLPRYGCLNVHASLLPRWRGAAPVQRAILAGDTVTGVSIMQMEAGLDTGPVLAQTRTPITAEDTGGILHDRLARLGADTLLAVLNGVAAGERPTAEAQDEANTCYAPKLQKAEARIDWRRPAEAVARAVRAYNPWPVAFTEFDDKPLRVWDAAAVSDAPGTSPAPGTIISADKALVIAAGQGAVTLREMQPAGKARMPAAAFLNARRDVLRPGYVFP